MAGECDTFALLFATAAFVSGCGADLCLNILLTLLAYFPGCLHAFWLVLKRNEANEMYGYKNWTYDGMGEYHPKSQGAPGTQPYPPYGQAQQAPPPGQYPSAWGPPPPGQAPVNQKSGYGYAPPPPPPGQYPAGGAPPPGQAPADQKGGYGYAPPPPQAPADTKNGGYQATDQKAGGYTQPADQKAGGDQVPPPPQAPADQKQTESTTQSTAPPSGT